MPALSQPFTPLVRTFPRSLSVQCRRSFFPTPTPPAGHNKWSKIRHDKAINDARKCATRTRYCKTIAIYSRLYGADLDSNPSLAGAVAAAKKGGIPKAAIESAIASGQGRTLNGAALEKLTVEAILPPSIALIIETETDGKLRDLSALHSMLKKVNGSPATSSFYFTRLGRVVFEKGGVGKEVDDIMEDAIEAGAEDFEADEAGNVVVSTQPARTSHICQAVGSKYGLKVLESEIVWLANQDTMVALEPSREVENLIALLDNLRGFTGLRAVYSNVTKGSLTDVDWAAIKDKLDW